MFLTTDWDCCHITQGEIEHAHIHTHLYITTQFWYSSQCHHLRHFWQGYPLHYHLSVKNTKQKVMDGININIETYSDLYL